MLQQFLSVGVFAFIMVFSRISAVIMLMPGLSESYVSTRIRLSFALLVTLLVAPFVAGSLPPPPTSVIGLMLVVGKEVVIGLLLGAAIRITMSALHVAGSVIAFQSSLGVAQFFDPAQGQQGALIGSFLGLVGLVMIFVTNLHHMLLMAIYDSYILMPPTQALPVSDFASLGVQFVSNAFKLGMQIAAPFIVYGLVYQVGLGFMQRLMPQLQLFFVAMPLQIMMALFIFMTTFSAMILWFLDHFEASMALFIVN